MILPGQNILADGMDEGLLVERNHAEAFCAERAVPGVEVIGPLPGNLQIITMFSAALDSKAANNEAAKAFLKFIAAPTAATAYKGKGLDPVTN